MIPLALFIVLLCAFALCLACNRDIFSPAKFYHASLAVFLGDVFLSEQHGYVYSIYFGFLLAGMLMSVLEGYTLFQYRYDLVCSESPRTIPARFVTILWALSVIPVLSQFYLIHVTGGLTSLARVIAHRVVEWQGLGHLVMLVKLIAPINIVYFAVGLVYRKRHRGIWWLLYALHLILFFVTATFLGGRTFVLGQVLLLMVIYNYLRRPVKLRYVLVAGGLLFVIAAVLGTVRNNLTRLENLDRVASTRRDMLNLRMFSYGINPLNAVFLHEFDDYQYGKTFCAVVTNVIPRRIWPGKFDSGGVVLTKSIQGHRYTGLSHMSTGLLAESIVNFGRPLGVILGFLLLLCIMFAVVWFYVHFRVRVHQREGLSRVRWACLYIYVGPIVGSSLFGDAAVQYGRMLRGIVLLSVLVLVLKLRSSNGVCLGMPRLQISDMETAS